MKIQDQGNGVVFLCDVCSAPLNGQSSVGVHHQQVITVHAWCRATYSQFFLNQAQRELTLAALVDEMVLATGS
jgi:hypothetical protein